LRLEQPSHEVVTAADSEIGVTLWIMHRMNSHPITSGDAHDSELTVIM
jgi:hypothetical protein